MHVQRWILHDFLDFKKISLYFLYTYYTITLHPQITFKIMVTGSTAGVEGHKTNLNASVVFSEFGGGLCVSALQESSTA